MDILGEAGIVLKSSSESSDTDEESSTPVEFSMTYNNMIVEIVQGMRDELNRDSLDELVILCQEMQMDPDTKTELLSQTSLTGVLSLLLKFTSNDVRRVMLILNDFVRKVIHDLNSELKQKMMDLTEAIERENAVFGLSVESDLHGRKEELNKLINLLSSVRKQDYRLINVCGMAGIGKSYLVKHLGSRLISLGKRVFYVNASGLDSRDQLDAKLLGLSASERKLMSDADGQHASYNFLFDKHNYESIVIIDDISTLMSISATKTLNWLDQLIRRTVTLNLKVKVIVTSQTQFLTNDSADPAVCLKIKGYTKDLLLTSLPESDARLFIKPSLQKMTVSERNKLVQLCNGHPYLLSVVGDLASLDFNYTTEICRISPDDVQSKKADLVGQMFARAFHHLDDRQREVIFAVSLFEGGAQLGALYQLLKPNESSQQFYRRTKKEFGSGFWLNFRMCKIKSEVERKTSVYLHHPLIRDFINKQVDSEERWLQAVEKMRQKFIVYHIGQLIEIGKQCVPTTPQTTNFIRSTAMRLVRDCSNFNLTFSGIKKCEHSHVMFSSNVEETTLRDSLDIAYLFVCLHQYDEWFYGASLKMLEHLVHRSNLDLCHRFLVQTSLILSLAVAQDWRSLDAVLKHTANSLEETKSCGVVCPHLLNFSLSLRDYATGLLYTMAPFLKKHNDPEHNNLRRDVLDLALSRLERLPAAWRSAASYFSVHVLLVKAESMWVVNSNDIPTIREGFQLCLRAKAIAEHVSILQPLVYTELASYRSMEGTEIDIPSTTSQLYEESRAFLDEASKLLTSWQMDRSNMAARTYNTYTIVMLSWANLLTEQVPLPMDVQEQARLYLQQAMAYAKRTSVIFEINHSRTNIDLLRGLYFTADCYDRLQMETPPTDTKARVECQTATLRYYFRAFRVIRKNYRSCHLADDDFMLTRMIERLPHLMFRLNMPRERVDKVRSTLLKVQEESMKEAERNRRLSGSDVSGSSDRESPDEDWSCDDMELGSLHYSSTAAGDVAEAPIPPPPSVQPSESPSRSTPPQADPTFHAAAKRPRT